MKSILLACFAVVCLIFAAFHLTGSVSGNGYYRADREGIYHSTSVSYGAENDGASVPIGSATSLGN